MKNWKPPYPDNETEVIAGGITIDKNALAYPTSPGTKEEAKARANLKCGTIYAKHD